MKRADLAVGGEYAYARGNDWQKHHGDVRRARIVDLGPFVSAISGLTRMEVDGTEVKGVAVRSEQGTLLAVRWIDKDGRLGTGVAFATPAQIRMPWENWAPMQAELEERDRVRAEDARRRYNAAAEERRELQDLARRVGITVSVDATSLVGMVRLSRADFRNLVEAALAASADTVQEQS